MSTAMLLHPRWHGHPLQINENDRIQHKQQGSWRFVKACEHTTHAQAPGSRLLFALAASLGVGGFAWAQRDAPRGVGQLVADVHKLQPSMSAMSLHACTCKKHSGLIMDGSVQSLCIGLLV